MRRSRANSVGMQVGGGNEMMDWLIHKSAEVNEYLVMAT